MKCEFCEGETTARKVTKQHWLNGRLYLVENVSAQVCRECGEQYFSAETLDEIDRLLSGRHDVTRKLEVEVVTLSS